MKKLIHICLAATLIISLLFSISAFADEKEVIYDLIFEEEAQQTFNAWGAHFAVDANPTKTNISKSMPAQFAQTVRDCNMTVHRTNFNQKFIYDADGTFHPEVVDGYANNFLIPLMENGVDKYIYCSWRPNEPHRYKDASNRNRIKEDHEDQYVSEVVNIFKYMREKGYPLPTIFSVQNEPDGAHVPADQLVRLFEKFDKALEEEGFGDILLAGPDVSSIAAAHGSYWGKDFSFLDQNPGYANALDMIHYHAYGNGGATPEMVQSIRNGLEKYPLPMWQTEVSTITSGAPNCRKNGGGNFFLGHSILMFRRLCGDFAWLNCDTWLWFMAINSFDYLATDKQSVFAYGGEQMQTMFFGGRGADGATSFQRYPTGNMLQILFTNVESGSKVHRLNSNDPDMLCKLGSMQDVVGFENSEKTTIIVLNPSDKTKKYNLQGVHGKSAKQYSVWSDEWQTVNERYYNVVDNTVSELEIKPYSTNIIVITNEDNAAPVIKMDMKGSAFEEADGTLYVREKNVDVTGYTDEKALVSVSGSRDYTDSENRFSINKPIDKDTEFRITATDKLGHKSDPVTITVKYDPNYVGIAYNEYDAVCNKDVYTLNGYSNTDGKFEIAGKTAEIGEDYKFSVDLPLKQGENVFEGIVRDNKGYSSNKAQIKVFCDSIGPEITTNVEKIDTNQRYKLMIGSLSEPVLSLTANGQDVAVKEDLSFTYMQKFTEGESTLKLAATDMYGNVTEKNIPVNYKVDANTAHKVDGNIYVRRTNSPVKIDGKLDEPDWHIDIIADKIALSVPTATARFGTMWDDSYFYVAAIIEDDKIVYDHQYAYANDSVEIMFNPSNEKAGTWVPEDVQLFAGYVDGQKTWHVNGKPINCEWQITDTGYICEIAVPWSTISRTPKAGMKLGFEFNLNDSDVSKSRNGIITWMGTSSNYLTTEDFGTAILADTGDEIIYNDVADEDAGDTGDTGDSGDGETVIERNVVKIFLNGKETKTKNMPVLENGKLRVSIDTMIELSGRDYTWIDEDKVVIDIPGIGDFNVQANNPTIQIGIHPDVVEVTPYKIDNGVYIGIDFVEKYSPGYFGLQFKYDEDTKTMYFTK